MMGRQYADIITRHHFMNLTMVNLLSRVTEPWSQIHFCCRQGGVKLSISCYWQILSETAVLDIEFLAKIGEKGWSFIADLGSDGTSGDWINTDIPLVTYEGYLRTEDAMWAAISAILNDMSSADVTLSYQRREMEGLVSWPVK